MIEYSLAEAGRVRLAIYDARGRMVRVLCQGIFPAGPRSAYWDGLDGQGRVVGTGVYFYRLDTPDRRLTGKMTLLK